MVQPGGRTVSLTQVADRRDDSWGQPPMGMQMTEGVPFGDPSQALFSGSGSLSHDLRPARMSLAPANSLF
jgi:hypothetical protein